MSGKNPKAEEFVFEDWIRDTLKVDKTLNDLGQQCQEDSETIRTEFHKLEKQVRQSQRQNLVAFRDFIDGVIDYLDRKNSKQA